MSRSYRGRHRTPSSLSAARVGRASAVVLASGGLLAGVSAGAQATPTTPAPAAPAAPGVPAVPVNQPASPFLATPSVQPATPISGKLRWGSRGDGVRTVQEIVGADVDGVFGPLTHRAVQRWQADNGLEADGIVGPLTKAAMGVDGGQRSASTSGAVEARPASSSGSRSEERSAPSAPSAPSTSGITGIAAQYTGIIYSYGGTSPSTGFDCSGYTSFVFAQAGISIPRGAADQQAAATPVSNPQPGDLVFFGSPAYHVGIYAGDGMMYDSGRPGIPTQLRSVFSGVSGYGRIG